MSNRLIEPISENTAIVKSRLARTINSAITEINQIRTLYDQFFAAESGKETLAKEIERKLQEIKDKYAELFVAPEGSATKAKEVDDKIAEIKAFHEELITGTKEEPSIEADIEASHNKINELYAKLFSSYEAEGDGGQESKLEAAFKSITEFDEELNKADIGYRAKIEKAKNEILEAYQDLIAKDTKSKKSKVDVLNDQIVDIGDYHKTVQDEIKPFITGQRTDIESISSDIKTKQSEVNSLLSQATVNSLQQGYKEAMQIYGDPVYYTKPDKGFWKKIGYGIKTFSKAVKHFVKLFGSYALFIGPLLLIGWIFVYNSASDILDITKDGAVKFSGSEYIVYKLTIALPLLWVSWYGQKSISHKKRLFEEYNHKLRVVQMYLLFTTDSDTYKLDTDTRQELEATLLDTIEKNPSDVYGDDETLVDKLLNIISRPKQPKLSNDLTNPVPRKRTKTTKPSA